MLTDDTTGPTRLLTVPELDALNSLFDQKKKDFSCRNGVCSKATIRRHGTMKNTLPPQTHFRCHTCTKLYSAYEMYQLLNAPAVTPNNTGTTTNSSEDIAEMEFDSLSSQSPNDFMTQIMNELQTQRERLDQHDTMYNEIQRLQKELENAKAQIAELEETNRQLRQQVHPPPTARQLDQDDFPLLSTSTQQIPSTNNTASQWSHPLPQRIRKPPISPETQQRRLEAAARAFQRPSETHGFQYLYFPSRARMPIGQMRACLRRFGIENNRVLDIHYPARQTIALLVHNDFVTPMLEKLRAVNIHQIEFNPLDPNHIHDPKYHDAADEVKAQLAQELQVNRARRAVKHIRAPIKYAVARDLYNKGWLPLEELKTLLATRWSHPDDPDSMAQNFRLEPAETDELMTEAALRQNSKKRPIEETEPSQYE